MRTWLLFVLFLIHSINAQAKISITHAYVRPMPPFTSHTAAFMQIENHSDQTLHLIKVSGEHVEKVELHQTLHENDVMRMRQVASIEISAKQNVRLAPNGLHLMLMGVKQQLKVNEEQVLPLSLFFSTGQRLDIELPVRAHEITSNLPKHTHDAHRH